MKSINIFKNLRHKTYECYIFLQIFVTKYKTNWIARMSHLPSYLVCNIAYKNQNRWDTGDAPATIQEI